MTYNSNIKIFIFSCFIFYERNTNKFISVSSLIFLNDILVIDSMKNFNK